MSRADTPTKLSLARWAEIVGIHPLHFSQVVLLDNQPSVCGQPWLQHAWQAADRLGREDIALAIAQAEDDIEREMKTHLAPAWEVDEWRPTERTIKPELTNLSITDIRAKGQIARAKWQHFISGGIQAKEVVEASSAIAWSDADNDSYFETGTITSPTTVVDPCEIHLYYPGKAGDDTWEIRPIDVTISGGVATVTFRRELAVLEDLLESLEPNSVDGSDDGNFLATVDVYRKYNDPQRQVQFLWEPFANCLSCGSSGCPSCAYSTQEGCLMVRDDPRLSLVVYHPATWNATTLEFDATSWSVGRQPDIVRVWYYSGLRDRSLSCSNFRMSRNWERVVAYYAASLLDRPICECNNVSAWIRYWRRDMALPGEGEEELASIDFDLLGNPFGTKRGAVFAWQQVIRSRDLPQEIAI